MPNRSYLLATNLRLTHPLVEDSELEQTDLVASGIHHVPLLWLAMFRPDDMVRRTVHTQTERTLEIRPTGERSVREPEEIDVEVEAPITSVVRAIEQVQDALPYLNEVFEAEGKLDEYAKLFIEGLRLVTKGFVTLDLEEIASMTDSEGYWISIRAALADMCSGPSQKAKERLIALAGLEGLIRLPPATLALKDHVGATPEDRRIHERILGAGARGSGLGRAVPWELEPTQFGYRSNAPDRVPFFVPRLDVLFTRYETERGTALTKEAALEIRDNACCMMLTVAEAAARPPANPPYLDPERCWEEWEARKKEAQSAKA